MTDPIRQYLETKKKFDAVTTQTDRMVALVRSVGMSLQSSPLHFSFANCSVDMPAEAVLVYRSRPSPDANQWPTAAQIHEQLKSLHSAKSEVEAAWSTLSAEDRSQMTAPKQYVPS